MAATLAQLQAFEAKLVAAIANPVAEVWYDDFRKKLRPVGELQDALAQVRREIAAHPDNTTTSERVRRHLPRARADL